MLYLICYDIVSNRRRKKVADVLLDFGSRVQKSAFECSLRSDAQLRDVVRRINPLLNTDTDTLRIYRVCAACRPESKALGVDRSPPPPPRTLIV
jgi:CRISPR-associated protein Cas2